MKNRFYLMLRMLTIWSIFGITLTTTAQSIGRVKTQFTDLIGVEGVGSSEILYANQIFIEHKSFLKQNTDLIEVIEVIRLELEVERNDALRLRQELNIYKELGVDQNISYEIRERHHLNTIAELKKDNILYKIIAVVATVTAILVVVIK